MGAITAALCLLIGETMVRREDQAGNSGRRGRDASGEAVERKNPLAILRDVFHEPALLRLIVLIALTLGVRAVYVYLYMLMPKYWERTIGADATIGLLNAINPVGIVIGLILFIPLANKFRVVNMLVFGSIVSALALVPDGDALADLQRRHRVCPLRDGDHLHGDPHGRRGALVRPSCTSTRRRSRPRARRAPISVSR